MESWRKGWRVGFAPQISDEALAALKVALEEDDARLMQGATTSPPPLQFVQDWPVEAACVLGFCGVVEHGGFQTEDNPHGATVAQAEEFFAKACFAADQNLGDPAACRWFLNWFDGTPRAEMRGLLLVEVIGEQERRAAPAESGVAAA